MTGPPGTLVFDGAGTRVTVLSGLRHKACACVLIERAGARVLLDCGRGTDTGLPPPLERVGPVDAVLLSHAHGDHAGALDRLGIVGDPTVHATAPVLAAPIVRERFPPTAKRGVLPLRGTGTIAGLRVETGRAGHALGAVWLAVGDAPRILYMGDHRDDSIAFPFDPPPPCDALLFDASYGPAPFDPEAERMRVMAALHDRPTLLLVPPDARAVEIAIRASREGLRVGMDEGVRAAFHIASKAPDALHESVRSALARLVDEAPSLSPASDPSAVMLVSPAQATDGAAGALVERFASTRAACVLATGHVVPGSPLVPLIETGRADCLRWPVHPSADENRTLAVRTGAEATVAMFSPAAS